MISHFNTYQIGVTQIAVGLSATVQVNLQTNALCNGGQFKILTGSGTLAIVTGLSNIVTQGYPVGTTEVYSFEGPANFFLAASSATMTIALCMNYSQGFSSTPR